MIRDLKRNLQGIIISTQLDNADDVYPYFELQRFVRKFNQNANNSSDSNFNEVYDDIISDIEFEEIIISNTFTLLTGNGGFEINSNGVDPLNVNLTPVVTTNPTSNSADGSAGSLNLNSAGVSAGSLSPNNVSGSGDDTTTTSANGSSGMMV